MSQRCFGPLRPLFVIAVFSLVTAAPSMARADEPAVAPEPSRWHLTADGDLFTLFSVAGARDYSLHMALRSPDVPAWIFGLGFFGGEYPDFYAAMLDWASGVDNDGFDVRVDGVLLRGLWFLDPAHRSFFVGTHLGVLRWENRDDATGSLWRSNQVVLWPAIGYRWYPTGEALFLAFWTGIGVLSPSFGTSEEGPRGYQELRLLPFAAVHLGVEI
ncbi:MAG TPA: hypothetical protein VFG83_17925 [Kofleriaceae bacterium]|nr:hypothetical protein [Kofleriaceae bacterium]